MTIKNGGNFGETKKGELIMQEFKLGRLGNTKKINIDEEGNISIKSTMFGDGELTIEDIKKVFISKPAFLTDGELYLSTTGNQFSGTVLAETTGFVYKKKQLDDVKKILNLLQEVNEELEIEDVKTVIGGSTLSYVNAIKCPKCQSTNVVFMDNKKKGFSVGKAVGGTILTGGIGSLAGFAGKKGKDRWHCQDCGNTFKKKAK